MNSRTIRLAEQLLEDVPNDEMSDLIRLLSYYNRFDGTDRALAMRTGSRNPADKFLEQEVSTEITRMTKSASARLQASYVTTNQNVCRCCGQ